MILLRQIAHRGDVYKSDIEMIIQDDYIDIPHLLEKFECFMKACGFVFDGELQLVDSLKKKKAKKL